MTRYQRVCGKYYSSRRLGGKLFSVKTMYIASLRNKGDRDKKGHISTTRDSTDDGDDQVSQPTQQTSRFDSSNWWPDRPAVSLGYERQGDSARSLSGRQFGSLSAPKLPENPHLSELDVRRISFLGNPGLLALSLSLVYSRVWTHSYVGTDASWGLGF
jgi:hypothetical protein